MAPKNPLGTIKDVADLAVATVVSTVSETVKDPVGTGQKMSVRRSAAVAAVGAVAATGGRRPEGLETAPPRGADRGEGTGKEGHR